MYFSPIVDQTKFQELCAELYEHYWTDPNCKVVGRSGQSQFGLDILGTRAGAKGGIQCKNFTKTKFTVETINDDVTKADAAAIDIAFLLFATTKDRDQKVTLAVEALNLRRKQAGLFAVEVSFWQEIEILLQRFPEVAARYYPNHPLSLQSKTLSTATSTHEEILTVKDEARNTEKNFASQLANIQADTSELIRIARDPPAMSPQANARFFPDDQSTSTESASYSPTDIALSSKLDIVKSLIVQMKTTTARQVLTAEIPNPDSIGNEHLRFRYYTNLAVIEALSGNVLAAHAGYERAYRIRPTEVKAIGNYVRTLLQQGKVEDAKKLCDQALLVNVDNAGLWSLRITIEKLDETSLERDGAPFGISEHQEVRFSLGAVALAREDYPTAIHYFERCFKQDPKSFEVRRLLLTAIVHLLSIKGAAEDSSLLSAGDRESIELILSPREETLALLKGIEADEIAFEINNNAHVALQMLGEDDRAHQLAAELYSRFPNAPSILRSYAEKRVREGQWDSVKSELIARLPNLSGVCRAGIGELALQAGDLGWFEECWRHPLPANDCELHELMQVLEILTRWKCGEKDAALKELAMLAEATPCSVMVVVALSKLEAQHGLQTQALARLQKAVAALGKSGHVREKLTLADGLYELKAFADVAELLSELVVTPRDDRTTRRLLESLLRSGHLRRARTLIESLPEADRAAVAIRRFEIELAHQTGDFDVLKVLLAQEFERSPTDAVIATNYAGILLALDRTDDLSRLLKANPQFRNSHPKHVFEFAKIEINCGFATNGHQRLYELWRTHPNDAFVAQCFFSQQMLNIDPEVLSAEQKKSGSFAVRILDSGVEKWIAVDRHSKRNGTPWAECVTENDPFAQSLLFAEVGQTVQRSGGFFPTQVKVLEFLPLRRFALEKAREFVENSSSSSGFIQSINVDAMGIDKFVATMTEMAHSKEKAVGRAFGLYKHATHEEPFFLNCLARLLNTDAYRLIHGWPYVICQMQIATGARDRQTAMRQALDMASAITVDLLTLLELQRIDALSVLLQPDKEVLVPRAVMEQLRYMRMLHAAQSTSTRRVGTFSTNNGRPLFSDQTPDDGVVADLDAVCSFVQDQCRIVPVVGPIRTSKEDRALLALLDGATAGTVRLCQERQIPLVTIDGYLGEFLQECYDINTLDLPLIIGEAHQNQRLTSQARAYILAKLVDAGRSFIGASPWDLFHLAIDTPQTANSSVERLIRVCEGAGVDVNNAFSVMQSFFKLAATNGVSPRVVGHYALTFRNALKSVRREYWTPLEIDNRIIDVLEAMYGSNAKMLNGTERAAMQRVMTRKPLKRFARSPLL